VPAELQAVDPLKEALLRLRGGRVEAFDRSGNLEDAAYAHLREALIGGLFSPGQTFTIRALAQVFGTSPMPVSSISARSAPTIRYEITSWN